MYQSGAEVSQLSQRKIQIPKKLQAPNSNGTRPVDGREKPAVRGFSMKSVGSVFECDDKAQCLN
jgi:hypothetical protein